MIRPTFLAFETAKRALSTSQAGLDIVGHNISNAQTAGYTRQRVDQVSVNMMNGTSSKYRAFGAANYGAGATLQGITQIRDPYLDNRYRAEATNNGELGIRLDGLTDINNIFDETMADGLSAKMSELLNTITVLAQSANIAEHATVVRDTANQFTQILNKNYNQLEVARTQQQLDLKITAEQDINTILDKIADLNKKIKEDSFSGNPSNELNDERNMLIDNLSEYFDIKVVRTPTKVTDGLIVETVSIELNNSGTPPLKLVDGGFANKLEVGEDPVTGNAIVSLMDGISGLPMEADLSRVLTKGGIRGYLDVLNGTGPNGDSSVAGGSSFRGIPYYMKALDEYAQQFAEVLNRVNNISDQEAADSGSSYAPLLSGSANGSNGADGWVGSVISGSFDFSGKNTKLEFDFDGTSNITTVIDGETFTATYSVDNTITFTGDKGNTFSVETTVNTPPTGKTDLLVDAGWPPVSGTNGNKNLIVPLIPNITDTNSATGEKPAWIGAINGGVIQFSGKEYDIEFGYNPGNGDMTANIGGAVYNGTYNANGKVEFRDDSGAVMFTVDTTSTPPDAVTQTKVDATITAKNISISQNWFKDALYITTTKSNAVNKKEASLSLEGTKPVWLNKVSMGPDAVSVPNKAYQFYHPGGDTSKIAVEINGIEYKADYKSSSTIELRGGNPDKVGLILETNHRDFGTKETENVATIRTDTGSKNDNISKLLSEISRSQNYTVSGITGSLEGFITSFQAQMAGDKDSASSKLDASLTVISTLANRRDSVSAVSIDEEGINMMTYQNYYNAAARYMTTIDEALDKIINGMGAVGR